MFFIYLILFTACNFLVQLKMFVLFWTSALFNTEYFTNKIFYFFYHAVNVTGPADTVGPPDSSVILGVAPNVNVYLLDVVTVMLKPLEFS